MSPGTSKNSRQHARVIYGWVHRPKLILKGSVLTFVTGAVPFINVWVRVNQKSEIGNLPRFTG